MAKLGIIGAAGTIGSTIAFYSGLHSLFDEIVLVDIKENVVKAHAMDMDQALSERSGTRISAGGWEDLSRCDIVILAAGVPETGAVESRNAFLEGNLRIMNAIAPSLRAYCKDALLINAMNPTDIFTWGLGAIEGLNPARIVGFCRNDSLRLRWAIGKFISVPVKDVEAWVIGEHGGSQVPLFSTIKIKGEPYAFTPAEQATITSLVQNWFKDYQALDAKRSSGWLSATSIYEMLAAVMAPEPKPVPACVRCEGQYGGVTGLCLGQPVLLTLKGYSIVELAITGEEMAAWKASAQAVKSVLQTCNFGGSR